MAQMLGQPCGFQVRARGGQPLTPALAFLSGAVSDVVSTAVCPVLYGDPYRAGVAAVRF
jgi:hypothetical protein